MAQAARKQTTTKATKLKTVARPKSNLPAVILPFPMPQNLLQVCANALKDPRADVNKAREVVALMERVETRAAEERFAFELAAAQREMPRVVKDKENESTHTWYATLPALSRVVDPIAYAHGFSMSFSTADCPVPGHYRVTGKLSLGMHTRDFMIDVPVDATGPQGKPNKTLTHGMASANSYGVRIMKMRMFNITPADKSDDDGNAAGGLVKISEKQVETIRALMKESNTSDETFFKWSKLSSVEEMATVDYAKAVTKLTEKKQKMSTAPDDKK